MEGMSVQASAVAVQIHLGKKKKSISVCIFWIAAYVNIFFSFCYCQALLIKPNLPVKWERMNDSQAFIVSVLNKQTKKQKNPAT